MVRSSRRRFLGATGVAMAVPLAGCSSNDDRESNGNGGDDFTLPGGAYPPIDEWLTETEVGESTSNYDGQVVAWTDQDTVTIDVGAEGNGDGFAFGPPAVAVSIGTTVEFNWTGQGNPHNLVADPEDQIGKSDYEFSSGGPAGGSGVHYTYTLDEPGFALYHCEPHLSIGMKGGIAVE